MRPIILLLLLLLPLLALIAWPAHAGNGLNRCLGADGTSIFTDRNCADIGAVERVEPLPLPGNLGDDNGQLGINGCARNPGDLLRGLKSALDAGDVNRLAAFYHWPGVSTAASIAILKRLQALVDHPLLSVDLLYAQRSHDASGGADSSNGDTRGDDSDSDAIRDDPPHGQAYAVQIVLTHSGLDPAPVRNTLALRRNIGCWWVRF